MTPHVTGAPRLTLGLPVYNGERFLSAAIDALLAQVFTDFELIISDNASTDRTREIAEGYARSDPRVRYVRHEVNRGSAFNHSVVVELARGAYFKWVSDDDLYHPELLDRCIRAFETHPGIVSAHAWTAYVDEDGHVTRTLDYPLETDSPRASVRFRSLLYTDPGGDDIYGVIPTVVMRRLLPYASHHHSDRTFVATLSLYGPFHNEPEFLFLRREHAGRATLQPSIRARCARLDPARANRWRHPVARLVGEYLLAYVLGIWRAPLSPVERFRCYRALGIWTVGHLDPRRTRDMAATTQLSDGGSERPADLHGPLPMNASLARDFTESTKAAR